MNHSLTKYSLLAICLFGCDMLPVDAQDKSGKYPEGIPTDTPGILISPFPPGRKIDVTGLKPGSLAMDPSVEKIFRIPSTTPETESNLGKEPAQPTGKPVSTTPLTTKPNRVMSPTQPSSVPKSITGDRFNRPRNPGLGNAMPPVTQPGLQTGNGESNSLDAAARLRLPHALTDFINNFNQSSSDNSPKATLPYFDRDVLYFGKKNQSHEDIVKDRGDYLRKYPYRKYRTIGEPVILSAENGVYELVFQVSYTVQGMGKPLSGKVANYMVIRKAPEGFLIVGIDETMIGASRPASLHKIAQKHQKESISFTTQNTPAFTGDIEEQIEQFVSAFIKSGEANDPTACLKFVDSKVSIYYDLKHPDQKTLLKDRSDYIRQWPRRTYVLTDEPDIKEIGDRIYEVSYQIRYAVRNNSRTVAGKERSIMQVAETEQGLKIISIFSE